MWWKQSTYWRDLKEPREEASAWIKRPLSLWRKIGFEWQAKYWKAQGSLNNHKKARYWNQELPTPPEESDDVDAPKITLMPAEFAEGNLQAYTDYKKQTSRKAEEAKESKKLKPVKISKN